jgi:adenosylhomocysteinase
MSASQVNDPASCERGRSLIEWSERRMPALALLKREFAERRPLDGIRIGGSLHLTPETGALARCRAGGASVALCGSNPLSTRDEICAALSFYDSIPTFAHYGEDRESYYAHMEAVAATRPDIVLDDGADLISFIAQLRFLAALGGNRPNGLFFAGDLGQRIFQQTVLLEGAGRRYSEPLADAAGQLPHLAP